MTKNKKWIMEFFLIALSMIFLFLIFWILSRKLNISIYNFIVFSKNQISLPWLFYLLLTILLILFARGYLTRKLKFNMFFKIFNPYFIITIALVAYVSNFGVILLKSQDPYLLPEMAINKDRDNAKNAPDLDISQIKCKSSQNYTTFVYPDFLYCNFKVNYKNNNAWVEKIDFIETNYLYNTRDIQTQKYGGIPLNGEYKDIVIKINKSGFTDYMFGLKLRGTEYVSYPYSTNIGVYHAISRSEYLEKKNQKINLFIVLISLATLSIFSGIKNLKGIIENNN